MNLRRVQTLISRIVICIISVSISHQLSAQAPDTSWTSNFKMQGIVFKIRETNDGGYILVGNGKAVDNDSTGYHGNYDDIWVLKLNATGHKEWYKMYGGSDREYGISIQQTKDSGYIVVGETQSVDGDVHGNHGGTDYWVLKLDKWGDTVWTKTLGGTGAETGASVQQTFDGGYIVSGYSRSNDGDVTGNHGINDYWVVKLDSSGAISWSKSYGGSSNENLEEIDATMDGGCILAGSTNSTNGDVVGSHGSNDQWLVKLNTDGAIEWTRAFGGTKFDGANSIQQTIDGGYIVAGTSSSKDGDFPAYNPGGLWIVKFASSTSECTWLGAIDNSWETPGNWSCGKVPDANSDVTISTGTVIVHADATCRSLKLATAASLTVQPGVHLNILQ